MVSWYTVIDLRSQHRKKARRARLLLYNDRLRGQEVAAEVLDLAKRTEAHYEIIQEVTDIREVDDGLFLRVQWEGLPGDRAWT